MFGKVRKKKVFTRIVSMILAVVFFATNVVMALPGYSFAEDLAEGGESAVETQETGTQSRVFDDTKIDVWDFGAESLGDAYNNRLDADTINGFYDGIAAGSTGVNITSFSVDDGDFLFNDGGAKTSHRLRTVNESITRFDGKSLKDSEGNVFTGYIYGNKNSNPNVYIALNCRADDIITVYAASNGNESTVVMENMSDASDSDKSHKHTLGSATVSKMVYYPKNTAQYRFYSADEKLVVARVLREHASYANISGTVSGFNGAGTFDLLFINRQNGNVVRSTVSEGTFAVSLAKGFDYDLSLDGAEAYVITSDSHVNVSDDESLAVAVSSVSLVNVKGYLSGIDDADLDKFVQKAVFTFTPDDPESVYVPQMNLTKGENSVSFEVVLQANIGYSVSVEGVDDYTLETKTVNYSADTTDATVSLTGSLSYSQAD